MKIFGRKMFPKKTKSKKDIIIVSGLPRCGTSMMMQMLEAGGMETVTDNLRKADEDNPRGYYELEAVKKIKEDSSWLESCYGKAFKMVSLLLYNLPTDKSYKVVFMKRDMDEMLASQKTMLNRLNKKNEAKSQEIMQNNFDKHLNNITKWMASQPNIDVIYMKYHEIVENPYRNAKALNQFLLNKLDPRRMAQVVEKNLYRQRRQGLEGVNR
jgi:hypothetical protein